MYLSLHAARAEVGLQRERTPITKEEKKKMITVAVITGVAAAMKKHCYSFDKTWREERDGIAVGNLLTGDIAKLVMAW